MSPTKRPGGESIFGQHLPGTGGDVTPATPESDVEGHLYTGGPASGGERIRRDGPDGIRRGGPEELRRDGPDGIRRDGADEFIRRAPGDGPHGEG